LDRELDTEEEEEEQPLNPNVFPRIGNLKNLHPKKASNGEEEGRKRHLRSVFRDGDSSSSSSTSASSSSGSSSANVTRGTRIDFFYGRKSIGFIKRMMFLIDLERCLHDSSYRTQLDRERDSRSGQTSSQLFAKSDESGGTRDTNAKYRDPAGAHQGDIKGGGHDLHGGSGAGDAGSEMEMEMEMGMEMTWETDWELRWEVLAAVLHRKQIAIGVGEEVDTGRAADEKEESLRGADGGEKATPTGEDVEVIGLGGYEEMDIDMDVGCVEYHSLRFTQNEWYEE